MIRKIVLAVLGLVLVVGSFYAGYVTGQSRLEREWRLPPMVLSEADVSRLKVKDADPVPRAGTKVLAAMPLRRARASYGEALAKDPVKVTLGSVGRSDDGAELHLVVKSDVACDIVSLEGTAYGFDARGAVAAMNKGGEPFVGFAKEKLEDKEKIGPKAEKVQLAFPLHHVESAAIALAQVDRYACADGTKWERN